MGAEALDPPPLELEPLAVPLPDDPPPEWIVLAGVLPPAVGTTSTYCPTPEFPGGAIVRT
jgi:hypothetical protein